MTNPLLEMKGISKSFPGVKVLENVQFSLQSGEVHALMGENGAGKSTLMKILGGIYAKDQGTILIKGQRKEIASPRVAQDLGIAIIHQELNLIPDLTVAENIYLGREFTFGKTGLIRWRVMREQARRYLSQLGMDLDPETLVGSLSVGQQQMVEIAKALSMQADILVLDEPTAALTHREIESLFGVIASLKQKGVGMIYISHRMEEIFQICDRVTVLRDGHHIGTKKTSETDMNELVRMMVGREITDRFPKVQVPLGKERLRVEGVSQKGKLHDISLTVRGGEILGIAGLMGAGRTELAKALFGAERMDSGRIVIDGEQVVIRKPVDAIRAGIALVTDDRKDEGLVLPLSVKENLSLPNLPSLSSFGFVKKRKEQELSSSTIKQLLIKTPNAEQAVESLSGGNQQKVVIGKWLATQPKILILDEPTRGVDIGAKKEIYDLMNQLAEQGVAIIMISSELPEVLGMSDRILVMHEGRITGEFTREEATQEIIMHAATGGGSRHAG
ncbi:sugar ABC transporter ATP-binding protein [Effusibacillus lacus]|uniref:D-ribose transporter ATP-binding protein n=1 Tax=Effusibacillus lacus TaxID=1348429 RepID=A0A292YI78_9BACL|nr:sugar ABC transporter ATP-binding protein [Effusibacillus lacus]TCS71104.1 ribose ABC transporter ATP-binding protein [Effusibacillus lacus]GAX90747.1 D-ribose transporter ATP-binding protein [Effusibacillus lacus]